MALLLTSVSITSISGCGTWGASADLSSSVNGYATIWHNFSLTGSCTSLTITYTGGVMRVGFAEFTPTAKSVAVDGTPQASNGTTTTTVTTGSLSPTGADNDLIFAIAAHLNNAISSGPTNSFTAIAQISSNTLSPAYLVVSSASGSYSTSWTFAVNQNYDTVIVAYKAYSVGGTEVPRRHN